MLRILKDFFVPIATPTALFVVFACSVLAAAAGPFGTYETNSFPTRLLYWSLVSATSLVCGHFCYVVGRKLVPEKRPVLTDVLTIAMMVAVFTPILFFLTHGLLAEEKGSGPTFLRLTYYVAAVSAGIYVGRRILPGFERIGYFGEKSDGGTPEPRLMRRLTPDFEGPILRLTATDHCVDVVSAKSVETIRFRFADAIDEMAPVVGHCTHRSHWVVRDSIQSVERIDGKTHLKLSNGDLVPVSRKYHPELEKAGVI